MCSSQLGSGKLCSSSFSVKQLHTLFEIFLLRKSLSLSLLMYIIMSLYPYGTVNIQFLLCIIIQYKLILLLRLFQLGPQGTVYFGSQVPLTYFHVGMRGFFFFLLIIFVQHFHAFWHLRDAPGSSCRYSGPVLGSTVSSKSLGSFY